MEAIYDMYEDLTGKIIGHWRVLYFDGESKKPGKHWMCECLYCGKVRSVNGSALRYGRTDHCGCQIGKRNGARQFKDLTGRRFGRLTVIEFDHMHRTSDHKSTAMWRCHCDCNGPNSDCICRSVDLLKGDKRSCGCLGREASKANGRKSATHGDATSRLYHIYTGMIDRCYRPTTCGYNNYGAKGVYVCDEWRGPDINNWEKRRAGNPGWQAFKKWAYTPVSEGGGGYYDQPKDTPRMEMLSIERKNYRREYSPENCVFIPMRLQAKNRSNNAIFFDGEEFGIYADICNKYGNSVTFISSKHSAGWPPDAIVHCMKHPELGLHRVNGVYRDKDGFMVLIPNYHAEFVANTGDEEEPV